MCDGIAILIEEREISARPLCHVMTQQEDGIWSTPHPPKHPAMQPPGLSVVPTAQSMALARETQDKTYLKVFDSLGANN